jgi:hypothetical protein
MRTLALALPEVEEYDHWGRPSFRVGGKIFLTLWPDERRAVLKLTPADQGALVMLDPEAWAAVPGAWGQRGWTSTLLDHVEHTVFAQSLRTAWREVAPKRLLKTAQER